MKANFAKVQLKDINGNDVTGDFRADLGQQMYMQGQTIGEVELGSAIYHQKADEPMTLTVEQAAIVSRWVERWPYVSRTAIRGMLNKE